MVCLPCQLQGIKLLWEMADWCSHTTHSYLSVYFFSKQKRADEPDRQMLQLWVYVPNIMLMWYLQCSYSSLTINIFMHPSEGAFNHIVLKESTLTYITMLINRTFPFCRRSQRATLSVSVAESPHSLGPIHVFPMLQFTHWIRLGPKKVFQSQLSSGKEKRRSGVGGEILKPFH